MYSFEKGLIDIHPTPRTLEHTCDRSFFAQGLRVAWFLKGHIVGNLFLQRNHLGIISHFYALPWILRVPKDYTSNRGYTDLYTTSPCDESQAFQQLYLGYINLPK